MGGLRGSERHRPMTRRIVERHLANLKRVAEERAQH